MKSKAISDGIKKHWVSRKIKAYSQEFDKLSINYKKNFIINEQNGKCAICKNNEWNGFQITLDLDHIDGVRTNNQRHNLRAICPNCHEQTDNYKAKNIIKKYSDDEIKNLILQYNFSNCHQVLKKLKMNLHSGNYKRIIKIMSETHK